MIEELRRFKYIYETGSITKAAKLTRITQPALSQSLKRLEESLKTCLVVRNNKNFYITDEGKSIYQMAEKILKIWDSMLDPNLRKEKNKLYTIGLFDNAAIQLAREEQFWTDSNIKTELIIDNSARLKNLLIHGVLDICICVLEKKNTDIDNSALIETYSEQLIPVSAKKHSEPLEKIPFLLYNKASYSRSYIDETFFKYKIQPNVIASSSSTTFLKELAILNKGVALLPKNFVTAELTNKQLLINNLEITWSREIGIFLSKKTDLTKSSEIISRIIKTLKTTTAHF
jgi:DNA-binding transcriptional LysR family regulator